MFNLEIWIEHTVNTFCVTHTHCETNPGSLWTAPRGLANPLSDCPPLHFAPQKPLLLAGHQPRGHLHTRTHQNTHTHASEHMTAGQLDSQRGKTALCIHLSRN